MKKILCAIALAVLLVSGTTSAKADTFIDSWSYSVSGMFIEWTSSAADDSGIYAMDAVTLNGVNGYHDLSWGPSNYAARSGIIISDTATGTVYTNGGDALALELTHRNDEIASTYPTLTSGKIYLTLTLEADVGGQVLTFDTTLSFDFIETTNSGPLQDDLFIIANIESSMENFIYDGYWYHFSFFGSFTDLNAEYPEYVARYLDPSQQYYGWETKENQTTTINTYLAINSGKLPDPSPTPEPGTMLLMGIGLAGLTFVTRRRTNK